PLLVYTPEGIYVSRHILWKLSRLASLENLSVVLPFSQPATDRFLAASLQDRYARNPLPPLRRAGLVHARSLGVDGHGHRHVAHLKFVNRLHAQVFERQQPRTA